MTKQESILILSLFYAQYKDIPLSEYLNTNDDDFVNEIGVNEEFLFPYVATKKEKVLVFYDDKFLRIKSFHFDELTDDKILNFISFQDKN